MGTREFNRVSTLADSNESKKSERYLAMAREFAAEAQSVSDSTNYWMTKKLAQEVLIAMRKTENADCEYTSYANAFAAEKWLEQAVNAEDARIDEDEDETQEEN